MAKVRNIVLKVLCYACRSEARTRLGWHKGAKRFVLDNGVVNIFVLRVCCASKAKPGGLLKQKEHQLSEGRKSVLCK